MPIKAPVRFREFTDDKEFAAALPLLRELNPSLSATTIKTRLKSMRAKGYRCVGAYAGKELAGICGFWVGTRIWCGHYIDLDNVIVGKKFRARGIGEQMVKWIEAEGLRLGCEVAVLDSYATFAKAHKFYFARGYHIEGYHMIKELGRTPVSRVTR